MARERDNHMCVVSVSSDPETRINRLENLICLSPDNHNRFGRGLFVLEPVGDPLAGLGDDGQLWSYEVKFSWFPQNKPPQATRRWDLTQVLDPGVQQLEEEDETIANAVLYRRRRQLRARVRQGRDANSFSVETGLVFPLTTTDPVTHPLPHPDLLVLHAAVMRVVRAAGASITPEMGDWAFDDDGSDTPVLEGVQEDLSYTLREYLNDVSGTVSDDHMPR
ncbi:hypothetical protein BGX38DRAFT_1157978 [Terfezia claveryi]|nr:hypothetical protein BGX38DRAFT_1157978 [Terfezia claveryi]